ncbi:MAG: hypothetical protein R3F56_14935 [Planctomycetota bacterium]
MGQALDVHFKPKPTRGAVLMAGFSTTTWAFGPLPSDLSVLQMPGCQLAISPDFVVPVVDSSASLPIPPDPTLAGGVFHVQALIVDLAVNPLGLVVSDAATALIGM